MPNVQFTASTTNTTRDVLTANEAGLLLRVHAATVKRRAALGDVPGRKVGKSWRFSRQALLEWLGQKQADQVSTR
jgi:excisionase family DNA binding protein